MTVHTSRNPRDFSATFHPPVHPVTTVVGPARSQTRYSGLLPGLTSSPLTALLHCHCAESARVGRMVHRVQSPPVLGSATAAARSWRRWRRVHLGRGGCGRQATLAGANRRWPSDYGRTQERAIGRAERSLDREYGDKVPSLCRGKL